MGRLTEPMGASGYWFGQSYDGVRAVWNGHDSQVRIGVGTFKHSTGITDSAYTHAVHEVIYRPPTAAELIGINRDEFPYDIESATKTGSDGEKNLVKIQLHQIALMVFMILLIKVRQIASTSINS